MQQKGEQFWEEKINRVGSTGTYMYSSASQRFRPGMQLGSRAQGLYCHPPRRKTGCAWSGRCVWASRQPIGALYRMSLISTSPWPCGRNPGGRSRLLCIPARRSEPESLASRSQSPTLSPLAPLRSLLLCSAMLSCCSTRPYIRLPKSSFELSKELTYLLISLHALSCLCNLFPVQAFEVFHCPFSVETENTLPGLRLENSDFQFYLIRGIGKLQTRRKN